MDTKQIGPGGERVFVDFLKYVYTANFFVCVCWQTDINLDYCFCECVCSCAPEVAFQGQDVVRHSWGQTKSCSPKPDWADRIDGTRGGWQGQREEEEEETKAVTASFPTFLSLRGLWVMLPAKNLSGWHCGWERTAKPADLLFVIIQINKSLFI